MGKLNGEDRQCQCKHRSDLMLEVLTMWSVCLCFCLVFEDLSVKAAILQMFLPHVRNWSSE